ncbi:MAG: alternative ribosome rescue aminoacyl-tRNA hydrolase ArfB [Ahrensia sp.]|nr:alternative ribosome rescue aminoacyl-tRNA hydrolase ArfB [Ahrensia sp.]
MSDGDLKIRGALFIRESDLQEKFIHSGGPGGQNVNKVATGVQLRYSPRQTQTLPWPVILKAEKLAGSKLNAEGEIVIQATRFRSQEQNREDARKRLVALLAEAAAPPPKKRKPTKPSLSARRKRMDSKTRRGVVKKLRGRVEME